MFDSFGMERKLRFIELGFIFFTKTKVCLQFLWEFLLNLDPILILFILWKYFTESYQGSEEILKFGEVELIDSSRKIEVQILLTVSEKNRACCYQVIFSCRKYFFYNILPIGILYFFVRFFYL